jgi:hypothetical protein
MQISTKNYFVNDLLLHLLVWGCCAYLCGTKAKDMNNTISNQTATETAIQFVIMDAIQKGHTNKAELIEYMKSDVFTKAVANYKAMIADKF